MGCRNNKPVAFILLAVIHLLAFASIVRAGDEIGIPLIRNYLPEEYKAFNQNWTAVQDKQGVMYFGNGFGVLVFYGNRWELVELPNKCLIRSLTIDDSGRVYVGGVGEFGYLAANREGKKTYVSLLNLLQEEDKDFDNVWECRAGRDGVYFSSLKKIFYFHDGKVEVLKADNNHQSLFLAYHHVLNSRDEGLFLLEKGKERKLPYCEGFTKTKMGTVDIVPFEDDKILICTQLQGLFIYDLGRALETDAQSLAPEAEVLKEFPSDVSELIRENPYFRAVKMAGGFYALCTWEKGLAIIDKQGKLNRLLGKEHGLLENTQNALYLDREDNLWVMSHKGISFLETDSPFSLFDASLGIESIPLTVIRHGGIIYVGTASGVCYLDSAQKPRHGMARFLPVDAPREQCFGFFALGDTLVAGGEGVIHITGHSGRKLFKSVPAYCFGGSQRFPNHIFCGLYPGLAVLEVEPSKTAGPSTSVKITTVPSEAFPDLSNYLIQKLIPDGNGDFWIVVDGKGVFHLQFTGTELTDYKITHYGRSKGLPTARGNYGYYLKGDFLISNDAGVFKGVHAAGDAGGAIESFILESPSKDLPEDLAIGFDNRRLQEKKSAFIVSPVGLGIMIRDGEGTLKWNPTPFKRLFGDMYQPYVDPDGLIWLNSNKGVLRYDPAVEKDYKSGYSAFITHAVVNNQRTIFNGTFYDPETQQGDVFTGVLEAQPPETVPTLEYKENSISFQYSAAFYENPSATRFSYILEGFNEEWSTWSAETKTMYTNLPGGDYRFKVKALNVFDHESAAASYRFAVSPPWYLTVYAYLAYGVAMLSVLFIIIRLYSRRLIAAKHRLEAIVADRTAEIKEQAEQLRVQNAEIIEQAAKLEKEREAANRANRSKSMFLARMSHEIRTPINGVIGFAEMLLDTDLNDEQADYSRTISRSGEALLTLINDILDFSKIEAGKISFEITDFDLKTMALDICHLVLPRIGDRPVEVRCRTGDDVPAYVGSDPGRFRQVLVNLMGNAVKFTQKGEIELAIGVEEETEDKLLLHTAVRDTGIGIPAAKQAAIFEDFEQVDGGTTRHYDGTGLGLAICKQIVQLMKGSIWVESEPGKGSTFHFTAWMHKAGKKPPRLLEPDGRQTVESAEKGESITPFSHREETEGCVSILLVEDNPINRKLAKMMLAKAGYRLETANNGKEAVARFLAEPGAFSMIFMDVNMPEMDGREATRIIREKGFKVPIIAVTADAMETDREKCIRAGMNGYITKPIKRETVFKMVKEWGSGENGERGGKKGGC